MNERNTKEFNTLEEKIALSALGLLHVHTGIRMEIIETNTLLGTGLWPDMRLRVRDSEVELISEIKTGINIDTIVPMIKQLLVAAEGRIPLFIADRIEPQIGQILREAKINYIDAGGNCYLNIPSLFIFIDYQPHANNIPRSKPARLFSTTDLQVIFALLATPELLNANYRIISEHANVALGVCGSVFRDLKDQGYFVESGRTKVREWSARHKLMGRWVEQYSTLRKKVFLGHYSPANDDWWQCLEFKQYDAHLGGDFAATGYTSNALDAEHMLYLDDQQQWRFIREMSFSKLNTTDEKAHSSVNVYSKFWGKTSSDSDHPQLTHPLISYADLIDAGDKDSREAANVIAERYFA
jgi:hypothetical protein